MNSLPLFKHIIRDKNFIFWQLTFPIILLSLFYMAFSGLIHPDSVEIDIAVAKDNQYLPIYRSISVLNLKNFNAEDAEQAIEEQEISAYIDADNHILVGRNGTVSTIVSSIVDQIEQINALNIDYRTINFSRDFIKNNKSTETANAMFIPFYAAIAMNAIYAAFIMSEVVLYYTANLSNVGQRIEMAPLKKLNLFGVACLMAIVINLAANLLSLAYIKLVLHLEIFTNIPLSILMIIVLNIFGVALGLFISTTRFDYVIKNVMVTITTLAMAFLSGMMVQSLRTLILRKAPILAIINPVSSATTALFRLDSFGDSTGHFPTIGTILLLSVLLFATAIVILRRRKYVNL